MTGCGMYKTAEDISTLQGFTWIIKLDISIETLYNQ